MSRAHPKPRREPTIALINVVFLMLVFFMVAGALAPPLDPTLSLVDTAELEGRPPPDALVLHADGRLSYRGAALGDAAAYLALHGATDGPARLVPDKAVPAARLIEVAAALRAAGAASVWIVTERALP